RRACRTRLGRSRGCGRARARVDVRVRRTRTLAPAMNGLRLVAIHQPTFLPWLGWWDKLLRADIFVLLDDVQYPKKGGTWMNRVRMLVNGEPTWVTMPIDRTYHGVRTVREISLDQTKPWRKKILGTLAASY